MLEIALAWPQTKRPTDVLNYICVLYSIHISHWLLLLLPLHYTTHLHQKATCCRWCLTFGPCTAKTFPCHLWWPVAKLSVGMANPWWWFKGCRWIGVQNPYGDPIPWCLYYWDCYSRYSRYIGDSHNPFWESLLTRQYKGTTEGFEHWFDVIMLMGYNHSTVWYLGLNMLGNLPQFHGLQHHHFPHTLFWTTPTSNGNVYSGLLENWGLDQQMDNR